MIQDPPVTGSAELDSFLVDVKHAINTAAKPLAGWKLSDFEAGVSEVISDKRDLIDIVTAWGDLVNVRSNFEAEVARYEALYSESKVLGHQYQESANTFSQIMEWWDQNVRLIEYIEGFVAEMNADVSSSASSAAAAAGAADRAAGSESQAASSASAAATSEANAKTSETNAESSASSASDSESSAETSASAAASSASAAATSEANAKTSETNAESSASSASDSESSAETSASAAASSASAAATSEANAKTSETNAESSASSASSSATEASGYASTASSEAASAAASASSASDDAARAVAGAATVGEAQAVIAARDEAVAAKDGAITAQSAAEAAADNAATVAEATAITEVNKLKAGAPEAFDTLLEIADELGKSETERSALANAIGEKAKREDVDAELAAKSDIGHGHAIADVDGLDTALAGAGQTAEWGQVSGTPDTFPPEGHRHDVGQIDGLDPAIRALIREASSTHLWDGVSPWVAPWWAGPHDSVINLSSGEIHSVEDING